MSTAASPGFLIRVAVTVALSLCVSCGTTDALRTGGIGENTMYRSQVRGLKYHGPASRRILLLWCVDAMAQRDGWRKNERGWYKHFGKYPVPGTLQSNALGVCRLLGRVLDASVALSGGPVTVYIYSGYRTPELNNFLPGTASKSMHLHASAIDFKVVGVTPDRLWELIRREGPGGAGYYVRKGFFHIDTRRGKKARWVRQ